MGTIHLDTEVMRQLGRRYQDWSDYLRNSMMNELRNLSGQLEGDWQGVSRQHYDNLIQQWEQSVAGLLDSGRDLGSHLSNTANRFENADNS